MCILSCFRRVWLSVTLWTVASQCSLSVRFSRQQYWSRLPFPPPGYLHDPGIKPASPESPVLAGGFFTHWAIWEALKKPVLKDRSSSHSASHHSSILAGHLCLIKFTMTFQSYFFWEDTWRCVFFDLGVFVWLGAGLSCSMWAPVPQPGIKPQPPALTMWNLSQWTTREVPIGV